MRATSRSTADAENALFERPKYQAITIARDRLRGSLRVVDDRSRLGGRANRGNRSGSFVRHSAAREHAHGIAAICAIRAAGGHSARFDRNSNARHQSARSFAGRRHGKL
jgi:hypothetical protein